MDGDRSNVVEISRSLAASDEGTSSLSRLEPSQTSEDLIYVRRHHAEESRFRGILDARELKAFFDKNYFGYGRLDGSRDRTYEALQTGLISITSELQNVFAALIEQRQSKRERIQLEIVNIQDLSEPLTAQLRLRMTQLDREIGLLQTQAELAEQHKGWVLEAINRYRRGFERGVREALDYELLNS